MAVTPMLHCVKITQRLDDEYAWYQWLKDELSAPGLWWVRVTHVDGFHRRAAYSIYFTKESNAIWFSLTWL